MESEEFSDGCPVECDPARCVDGRCEEGSELFIRALYVALFIGLPILCCLFRYKQQIENSEMIESEDEVTKTYQIARERPSKVCSSQFWDNPK